MNTIHIQIEAANGEIQIVSTIRTNNAILICMAENIKINGGLYEVLGYDVDLTGDTDESIVHLDVVEVS